MQVRTLSAYSHSFTLALCRVIPVNSSWAIGFDRTVTESCRVSSRRRLGQILRQSPQTISKPRALSLFLSRRQKQRRFRVGKLPIRGRNCRFARAHAHFVKSKSQPSRTIKPLAPMVGRGLAHGGIIQEHEQKGRLGHGDHRLGGGIPPGRIRSRTRRRHPGMRPKRLLAEGPGGLGNHERRGEAVLLNDAWCRDAKASFAFGYALRADRFGIVVEGKCAKCGCAIARCSY